MEEEKCCNTCLHYDVENGVCKKDGKNRYSFEGEDCDRWSDWEMEFYRGRGKDAGQKT